METKAKTAQSTLDAITAIQEAIQAVERAEEKVAPCVSLDDEAFDCLQAAKGNLSKAETRMRDLRAGKVNGRSPRKRKGAVPSRRNNVDGAVPTLPRQDSSKRSVGDTPRVSGESSDEIFDNSDLPF